MKRFVFLLGVFVVFSGNTAAGAITYDIFLRAAGLADGLDTTATVMSGQSFAGVEVVFRETVTAGDASFLAAANLNAYAVDVSSIGSNGNFANLTLNVTGGFAAGPNDSDTLHFGALGVTFGQPGRSSVDLGGGQREAILGTLDMVAPLVGSTTFTLADAGAADGDFTTFLTGAAGLESLSIVSGGGLFGRSLTLSVVPEPSSLMFVSFATCFGAIRRRRAARG